MSVSDMLGVVAFMTVAMSVLAAVVGGMNQIGGSTSDRNSSKAAPSRPEQQIHCICDNCQHVSFVSESLIGYWHSCIACGQQFKVVAVSAAKESRSKGKIWLCRIEGDQLGPMSTNELVALARSDRLTGADGVRKRGEDPADPSLIPGAGGKPRDTMVWHFPNSVALESTIRIGESSPPPCSQRSIYSEPCTFLNSRRNTISAQMGL